jgi:hypothetical protein
MMEQDFPEADWKVFREVQKIALDRFCKPVLDETASLIADSRESHHKRYLALYRLLQNRDKEPADLFDDPRRSTARIQLLGLRAKGLLTDEEFARFSERTRAMVLYLLGDPT